MEALIVAGCILPAILIEKALLKIAGLIFE
jgi:hypothetical protein